MSNLFMCADLHWGHENVLKFGRGDVFNTIEDHDEAILDNINSLVGERDTLWILGDFAFRNSRPVEWYRKQIRCRDVHLVFGNHDPQKPQSRQRYEKLFSSTQDYVRIKYAKQAIVMCHYPIISHHGKGHGAWMLHGHSHGRLTEQYPFLSAHLMLDVGIDCNNYKPFSFDQIKEIMDARKEAMGEQEGETRKRFLDA